MAKKKQTTEEAQGASNDVAIVAPIEETTDLAVIDSEEETIATLPAKPTRTANSDVIEVYGLVKAGYTFAEIRQMQPTWSRDKFYAIKASVQKIIKKNVMDKEEALEDVITKYRDLYQIAYSNCNIRECRNILDSLSKVQGLNKEVAINADFVAVWN